MQLSKDSPIHRGSAADPAVAGGKEIKGARTEVTGAAEVVSEGLKGERAQAESAAPQFKAHPDVVSSGAVQK